ncbi:hypothetical protein DKM44_13015 [Deinococcus irradiatisoli]|uniref:HNH nuclease domain-containing protein n=1 Tax=Deinococcus irradiatisoli TaxID=2202254 RepID=A0A2Z3JG78_9DEIO|nr:HNH endonuclease [Deinococcus irradiatisoli]AWN24042.1 hypothetical protein DKM44_13015 [Deinococcus irradiatisoli]
MPRADNTIHNQTLNASIPKVIRLAVIQRDGKRCAHCGATESLEFAHIVPPAQGGATVLGNVQVLCAYCITRKK